jgi:hypothetical protein
MRDIIASAGKVRNEYKILSGNLKGRDHLGGMISDKVIPVIPPTVSFTKLIQQYSFAKERKATRHFLFLARK